MGTKNEKKKLSQVVSNRWKKKKKKKLSQVVSNRWKKKKKRKEKAISCPSSEFPVLSFRVTETNLPSRSLHGGKKSTLQRFRFRFFCYFVAKSQVRCSCRQLLPAEFHPSQHFAKEFQRATISNKERINLKKERKQKKKSIFNVVS